MGVPVAADWNPGRARRGDQPQPAAQPHCRTRRRLHLDRHGLRSAYPERSDDDVTVDERGAHAVGSATLVVEDAAPVVPGRRDADTGPAASRIACVERLARPVTDRFPAAALERALEPRGVRRRAIGARDGTAQSEHERHDEACSTAHRGSHGYPLYGSRPPIVSMPEEPSRLGRREAIRVHLDT
jgi:hypothetical protein